MKRILILLVFTVLLACDGKEDREANCSNVLCIADQILITFRDSAGVPLIGTKFVKDSFKLSSANSVRYIKPISTGLIENLAVWYSDLEIDTQYALELSPTAIDTLRFSFTTDIRSCCTVSTMEELKYNGSVNPPEETNFYVFIRD